VAFVFGALHFFSTNFSLALKKGVDFSSSAAFLSMTLFFSFPSPFLSAAYPRVFFFFRAWGKGVIHSSLVAVDPGVVRLLSSPPVYVVLVVLAWYFGEQAAQPALFDHNKLERLFSRFFTRTGAPGVFAQIFGLLLPAGEWRASRPSQLCIFLWAIRLSFFERDHASFPLSPHTFILRNAAS